MPDEQKTVFISYRRKVASFIARAIFLELRAKRYDVFMDVESINAGQFETIILNQIEARTHFLIILTPGTLERCAEPGDWLRREIEYAMEKKRNIIPVFVNDFKFDEATKKLLIDDLAKLSSYQGWTVTHELFNETMTTLRKRFLTSSSSVVIKPTTAAEKAIVEEKIEESAAQPVPTREELSAEVYFARGYEKQGAGDLANAIADYTRAIEINPEYMEAYNNRGNARQVSGDLSGAIADYTEAIRLNPQLAEPYNNQGSARYHSSDLSGAIADYTEAIRLNPQLASAFGNRGEGHFALRNYEEALADFQQADVLKPEFQMTLGGLAITQFMLENYGDAKRIWRGLVEQGERYRDADWVGEKFGWRPKLVEAARKLIATL